MRSLVLITGTGRSGTSTMSGTLHFLGLSVPGPYLGANRSNPKGFFESKWSVQFHRSLMSAARVDNFDGRPSAFDQVQRVITPEVRDELRAYLDEHSAEQQLVVKDPRTVWAQQLWRECAEEAGREIRFISMLRHPAEVVGSRTTYYAKNAEDASKRQGYQTASLARWINNSLVSERETREAPRAFVKYTDLLEDWRSVARRLSDELGLQYSEDLSADSRSPVDDFIDPDLRRHRVTWDDLDVPVRLRTIAESVWEDVVALSERAGVDVGVSADLDKQSAAYESIFSESAAISSDAIQGARLAAQAEGVRSGRRQARRAMRRRMEGVARGPAIDEVGVRELLREVARRGTARVRGWRR